MINVSNKTLQNLRFGEISVEQFADELLENYPVKQIALALAEMLANTEDTAPITISEEDFEKIKKLFKIKGLTVNGLPETRGRKPKEPKEHKIED